MKSALQRVSEWARAVKRDVLVVYLVARDSRVPWPVKVLAAAVAAYALSPIDLIPDFIPIVGYLDDLVIARSAFWRSSSSYLPRSWRSCAGMPSAVW